MGEGAFCKTRVIALAQGRPASGKEKTTTKITKEDLWFSSFHTPAWT
jgi:hypothetical protein